LGRRTEYKDATGIASRETGEKENDTRVLVVGDGENKKTEK
jgi:hypothetical protein